MELSTIPRMRRAYNSASGMPATPPERPNGPKDLLTGRARRVGCLRLSKASQLNASHPFITSSSRLYSLSQLVNFVRVCDSIFKIYCAPLGVETVMLFESIDIVTESPCHALVGRLMRRSTHQLPIELQQRARQSPSRVTLLTRTEAVVPLVLRAPEAAPVSCLARWSHQRLQQVEEKAPQTARGPPNSLRRSPRSVVQMASSRHRFPPTVLSLANWQLRARPMRLSPVLCWSAYFQYSMTVNKVMRSHIGCRR